jgi:hypothetical protein
LTKHTILFLAANPVGADRLALDREARAIRVELERSHHRAMVSSEQAGQVLPQRVRIPRMPRRWLPRDRLARGQPAEVS